jgi:hypothetical protein
MTKYNLPTSLKIHKIRHSSTYWSGAMTKPLASKQDTSGDDRIEKISFITYLNLPEFGITLLIFTFLERPPNTSTVTSRPKSSSPTDTPTTSASKVNQIPKWELKVELELSCITGVTGVTCRVFVTLRNLNRVLIVGETVYLEIVDGPHAGLRLELETDENGQGFFSYAGEKDGMDVIRVWAGVESFEEAPKGMSAEVTNKWLN